MDLNLKALNMKAFGEEQLNVVSGGNPILGVIVFFSSDGYESAVNFTSGAIEGFVNRLG